MDYFEQLTEQAKEGNESPLKAFIELRKELDRLTALSDQVKRAAIAEAGNMDSKDFEVYGAKIVYVESAGSRWDFSNIFEWKELERQKKELEDKHKSAYQAWKRGSQYIDENGEVIPPAAYKEGNPTIQVKIK